MNAAEQRPTIEQLNVRHMGQILSMKGDKKFMELQKSVEIADSDMVKYLKSKIPKELK